MRAYCKASPFHVGSHVRKSLLQYKGTCVTEHVVGSISQDVLQLEFKHCYLMYNKQILQTTVSPTHV